MIFRLTKILVTAALALQISLVAFGNITDLGGEWFGMRMSDHWNGIQSAFRLAILLLAALIYLERRDAELE